MLVGEAIDDITAIAIQHYIKTIDYDAWNIYVQKKTRGERALSEKKLLVYKQGYSNIMQILKMDI